MELQKQHLVTYVYVFLKKEIKLFLLKKFCYSEFKELMASSVLAVLYEASFMLSCVFQD